MTITLEIEKKIYLWAMPIIAVFALFYVLLPISDISKPADGITSDLVAQLTAAKIVRAGEIQNLYNYDTQKHYQAEILHQNINAEGLLAFRTPPTTAVLYSALPVENIVLSFWITVILNVAFIIGSIFLLSKSRANASVLIVLAILSTGVSATTWGGQISGLILLILSLVYKMLEKNRHTEAGVLTALLFLKPNFLIAAPLILVLIKNRKNALKYVSGLGANLLLLLLTNLILFGTNFISVYIPFLLNTENYEHGTELAKNINIFGVFYRGTPFLETVVKNYAATILSAVIYLTVLISLYKKQSRGLTWGYICAMMFLPVLNPHTMHTDLLVHLLPLALIFPVALEKRRITLLATMVFVLIFLPWAVVEKLEWLVTLAILALSSFLLFEKTVWVNQNFEEHKNSA